MIKVCYIITKLELGGAQKTALYVAKSIDKNNFETFLITGVGGVLDKEIFGKIKLYQLKSLIREIKIFDDLKALIDIYSILKKEKPDIVHTHSSKAGVLGRIAARLANIKIVLHTVHGYSFNETQSFLKKNLYVFAEKLCAKISDKLINVSKEDIKKGIKYKIASKNKFTLIRAGIDVNFYKNFIPETSLKEKLNIPKKAKILTVISPFKAQKNLQDFIKAANIVQEKHDDVFFLIVGDGRERLKLENLIKTFKLQNKIILLGWRNDVAHILSNSDVFVLTSLWEGLPCAILEAMASSKPVIANAVDGVKEIIEDGQTGFLIEPKNYQMTAEKMVYFCRNESVRQKMGENAKNSITEEFDINYNVKQHQDLYVDLFNKKTNLKEGKKHYEKHACF